MINEAKLLKRIEEVCSTPKKYTVKGTFSEVADFLEKQGRNAIEGEFDYHSVFTPFLKWFVEKFDVKEKLLSLKLFQKTFSSDSEALEKLPLLYREYVERL